MKTKIIYKGNPKCLHCKTYNTYDTYHNLDEIFRIQTIKWSCRMCGCVFETEEKVK